MTQVKVSALPAADALTGAEQVMVVQGGVSKRAPVSAIAEFQRDHAAIYVKDGAYAQAIGAGSTPVKLTHFAQAGGADSHADGMVADAANSRLVAARAGHYLVQYQLSITCDTNNVTWECYAFANGVEAESTGSVSKIGTGADAQSISGVGVLELGQGEALDLRMYHNNIGSVNLTVGHASLVAIFLHD